MLKEQLMKEANFLKLTCEHENIIAPFSFDVDITLDNHETIKPNNYLPTAALHVKVIDTGIIQFEPICYYSKSSALIAKPSHEHSVQCKESNAIVISCGVHGNETGPIEICNVLIEQLLKGKIALTHRVLFIIGNPKAINQQKRFVDENLNSVFAFTHSSDGLSTNITPDTPLQNNHYERDRAYVLEQAIISFYTEPSNTKAVPIKRLHYDLHTAIKASKHEKFAIYPYMHDKEWDKNQLSLLSACGVNTLLFANAPTHTLSYFASQYCDAISLTVELGQVRAFGDNDITTFNEVSAALKNLMSTYMPSIRDSSLAELGASFNFYEMSQRIYKQTDNFTFNFLSSSENFTAFNKGALLAHDGEIQYHSKMMGEAILFPNASVPIGQRALLTVKPVTVAF